MQGAGISRDEPTIKEESGFGVALQSDCSTMRSMDQSEMPCTFRIDASELGVTKFSGTCTGVSRSKEGAPPQDPTVALCLGSLGVPRGVGCFV